MGDSAGRLPGTSELTSANTHDAVVHFVILMSRHGKAVYSWTFFSFHFWKQTGSCAGQTGGMTLSAGLNPVATARRRVRLLPFDYCDRIDWQLGPKCRDGGSAFELNGPIYPKEDTSNSNNIKATNVSNISGRNPRKQLHRALEAEVVLWGFLLTRGVEHRAAEGSRRQLQEQIVNELQGHQTAG